MPRLLPLLTLALLAACGADGPPVPPSQATTQPGVTLSGTVSVGMVSK